MSKESVQYLLKKYKLSPNTMRGQHFLVDDSILARIVAAAHIDASDAVLEVGPGIGTMTSLLVAKAKQVVACEVDRQFEPLLSTLAAVNKNLKIVWGDFLKTPEASLVLGKEYKIVANLPYYLTAHFFQLIMNFQQLPTSITVVIQKEVAERIVAKPGDLTKIALGIQFYGTPRIAFEIGRRYFNPVPAVDSAALVITNIHNWEATVDERHCWQLIKIGFSAKRKKLINNLAGGLQMERDALVNAFEKAGIGLGSRAQELAPEEWVRLAAAMK